MRFEEQDLVQSLFEVTAKAHGPIVDEDVCGGLSSRDGRDIREQAVFIEPSPHLRVMARREDDDVEAAFGQRPQERVRTGPRRVPVIRVLPSGVGVEHTVQIHAHNRSLRILQINLPGLPGHSDQTTIYGSDKL
jgi:hypothetical protein